MEVCYVVLVRMFDVTFPNKVVRSTTLIIVVVT
jgi:hypothetical protein